MGWFSKATNYKESMLPPLNLPYLPDDILLNCLARVSRLYYPTLSLVSKRFHSLIASLELYKTRRLLGCTESCLYLCIHSPLDHGSRWFTLCTRPPQISNPPSSGCFTEFTLSFTKEKKSSNNLMVPVPTSNSYLTFWSELFSYGPFCLIGNVLYYYAYIFPGVVHWHDLFEQSRGVLKGVKKMSKLVKDDIIRLVNYDGKLAVLWMENDIEETMIWCAKISLVRPKIKKICGKVEWCNVVLTVPRPCYVNQFIAATI